MAGVYGTAELQKIAVDLAALVNSAFKGGLLGGLGILSSLSKLQDVNFPEALSELKELDADDREAVEAAFDGALNLSNPAMQIRILAAFSSLDDAVGLVQEGISLFQGAVALEQKVKSILGL